MGQDLLSGVLVLSVVLLNPSSTPSTPTTSLVSQTTQMRDYAVKEGDAISKIAQQEYGSSDFWTNIWNDNPWIENPNLIEEGWILKIKNIKPTETEDLKDELEQKLKPTHTILTAPTTLTTTQTYSAGPLNENQINFLGNCESGMTAARNSGNGYFGAFQFSYGTWRSMGTAYERPDMAPIEVQKDAVQRLVQRSIIFTQFPACARKMQALGIL